MNGTGMELLKVESLSKKFKQDLVLEDVSFTAQRGDVISIIGPSGSGKSTLLRCINFLETPSEGKISLKNETIEFFSNKKNKINFKQINQIRKKVTMVFQHFNLWSHLTVYENIVEAPLKVLKKPKLEVAEKANYLLEKVGLSGHKDHYPSQLSGGQKQRIAIARALAMDPEMILFDEPTSALDPELVQEVLKVIKNLAQEQLTMLIVSHEINFSKEVSNKTMFLHGGKIVSFGETAKVYRNKEKNQLFKKFLSSVK